MYQYKIYIDTWVRGIHTTVCDWLDDMIYVNLQYVIPSHRVTDIAWEKSFLYPACEENYNAFRTCLDSIVAHLAAKESNFDDVTKKIKVRKEKGDDRQ